MRENMRVLDDFGLFMMSLIETLGMKICILFFFFYCLT